MVRPKVDELKANAFALSKILGTYKVKLSSQQCLDVLSKLTWNAPYEAVLAQELGATRNGSDDRPSHIGRCFDVARAFCRILESLDREGVNGAAWNGHKVPKGLHWDGRAYLKAAGAAALNFSMTMRSFIEQDLGPRGIGKDLRFRVEHCEPIVSQSLATLRVQSLGGDTADARPRFAGIDWKVPNERLLFGAEGRVVLALLDADPGLSVGPYRLVPRLDLSYEVCGQGALALFGKILRSSEIEDVWKMVPMEISTRILLTTDRGQESLDDEWLTESPDAKQRLLEFCLRASKLNDEETRDWPPYLTLTRRLDATNSEADLRVAFASLCAHVASMRGDSGGWNEILKDRDPAEILKALRSGKVIGQTNGEL
jgi:hypothetical protein